MSRGWNAQSARDLRNHLARACIQRAADEREKKAGWRRRTAARKSGPGETEPETHTHRDRTRSLPGKASQQRATGRGRHVYIYKHTVICVQCRRLLISAAHRQVLRSFRRRPR